jgi:hypothetical protein
VHYVRAGSNPVQGTKKSQVLLLDFFLFNVLIMRLLLIIISVFTLQLTYGQKVKISKLATGKLGENRWEIIERRTNDTKNVSFILHFKSEKPIHGKEFAECIITGKENLSAFVELIESYSTKEYGVNADANFSSGRLQIKAANKQVFLFNTKGEYTLISKMYIPPFVAEINSHFHFFED